MSDIINSGLLKRYPLVILDFSLKYNIKAPVFSNLSLVTILITPLPCLLAFYSNRSIHIRYCYS